MTRTELAMVQDLVRTAQFPVAVGASGIPECIEGEGLYELMEFLAALTEGYNTALKQLQKANNRLKLRATLERALAKKGD